MLLLAVLLVRLALSFVNPAIDGEPFLLHILALLSGFLGYHGLPVSRKLEL